MNGGGIQGISGVSTKERDGGRERDSKIYINHREEVEERERWREREREREMEIS